MTRGPVIHRYSSGRLQQHFAGLLWVPAGTRLYAARRKLVLVLRDQGVHTQEIAQLAGVTTRRVRQILAQARDAEQPTYRSASRKDEKRGNDGG